MERDMLHLKQHDVRAPDRVIVLLALTLPACSSSEALDPPASSGETLSLLELARQVTVTKGFELTRLDAPSAEEGVGGAILLNSELILDGVFKEAGLQSTVEGGRIVGTMHGQCTTTGGAMSLANGGLLGTIAQCVQSLNFYERGQVVVSGLIEQQNFEHNAPQTIAVI